MFCSSCGASTAEGAAFCGACGRPVSTTAAGSSPAAPAAASTGSPAAPVAASGGAKYAGFWLRLVAHLIDGAILTIGFLAVVGITVAVVGVGFFRSVAAGINAHPPATDAPLAGLLPAALFGLFLVVMAVFVVLSWLYYAWMESSAHQGTLGKMALGLTVTDMQARSISFGRASGRFFSKFITQMIPLGIGYILAGFTEKKQALHDIIAGCLVLRKI